MPPRKKPVRRTARTAKPPARRNSKTKALAIAEPVKRQAQAQSALGSQMALLDALAAWSPMQILVSQQAAFWEGFTDPSRAPRAGKRQRPAKSK